MNAAEVAAAKKLLDLTIRHQISLQRYSNGQVRRLMSMLNRADADIFAALTVALERLPAGTATVEYLESMLGSVRALNQQAYQAIEGGLIVGMRDLAGAEANYQFELFRGAIAPSVSLAAVSAEQAWQAVYSRPFAGKMLREVVVELGETRAKRIRDAVRMGYLEGKPTAKIVSDIRGTRAKGFVEGFVETDRRNLETTVRTALSHTAAGARNRFYQENEQVIDSQMWLSTLDSRTSDICIARSGRRYTLDERPKPIGHSVPWCTPMGCGPGNVHYNCRSTALPLLPGQTKLYGTRASAGGQVDANMSYGEWLKTQPAGVQDEVLGPTRGKLFRDGGLTIDKFQNDKGVFIDIDQLRERDAAAFKKAGVQ
ncbi:phage minor head protein [Variovorax ginsengisoli]|uniref:Phage minor head protein n=1 Tax=Variovorax ginsengisoli TaxID=363844 RepID=A0ABT8RZ55_9BURK|nr:phage minor head protein [Variovorax ginsengisoli]MDN8612785.1 phage minor head protein [Variovorax ginsengisoli]MDO1531955.1 phage minor head protein [Variovorax ginsengisoli]